MPLLKATQQHTDIEVEVTIDLTDYEQRARAAVQVFWQTRQTAGMRQVEAGKLDQGERASVTAGKTWTAS